jgi:branched-subunit amino acid aminotransferase/4-amino-4-deoxychorismate lyase
MPALRKALRAMVLLTPVISYNILPGLTRQQSKNAQKTPRLPVDA